MKPKKKKLLALIVAACMVCGLAVLWIFRPNPPVRLTYLYTTNLFLTNAPGSVSIDRGVVRVHHPVVPVTNGFIFKTVRPQYNPIALDVFALSNGLKEPLRARTRGYMPADSTDTFPLFGSSGPPWEIKAGPGTTATFFMGAFPRAGKWKLMLDYWPESEMTVEYQTSHQRPYLLRINYWCDYLGLPQSFKFRLFDRGQRVVIADQATHGIPIVAPAISTNAAIAR
jgi:hypothetical protein